MQLLCQEGNLTAALSLLITYVYLCVYLAHITGFCRLGLISLLSFYFIYHIYKFIFLSIPLFTYLYTNFLLFPTKTNFLYFFNMTRGDLGTGYTRWLLFA